jgi:hypothetical protein
MLEAEYPAVRHNHAVVWRDVSQRTAVLRVPTWPAVAVAGRPLASVAHLGLPMVVRLAAAAMARPAHSVVASSRLAPWLVPAGCSQEQLKEVTTTQRTS